MSKVLTKKHLKKLGILVKNDRNLKQLNGGILYEKCLHLIHAPSAYGKSSTVIKLAGEAIAGTDMRALYMDFELNPTGGNHTLDTLCNENGVIYVPSTNEVDGDDDSKYYNALETIIKSKKSLKDTIIIFDSFSSLIVAGNNDATDTKDVMKQLAKLISKMGATVVVIEHSTKGEKSRIDDTNTNWDFKLEGNESGKKKLSDFTYKVQPLDGNIRNGVVMKVEKTRNQELTPRDEVYNVVGRDGKVVGSKNHTITKTSNFVSRDLTDNQKKVVDALNNSKDGTLTKIELETILCKAGTMGKQSLTVTLNKGHDTVWDYKKIAGNKHNAKEATLHAQYKTP